MFLECFPRILKPWVICVRGTQLTNAAQTMEPVFNQVESSMGKGLQQPVFSLLPVMFSKAFILRVTLLFGLTNKVRNKERNE